jgi:hypothetical protein
MVFLDYFRRAIEVIIPNNVVQQLWNLFEEESRSVWRSKLEKA